ncbi:aspartate aminotransferase family protein [Scatolibacter rhodanostii]|uniref:aspartate aminotransferase family protein n=1 Tax=Scatolibacter rhodanostii TaxID=2014781 RepID=UPI000C071338|nr:aspartate aminotransferase family protein [Scatolibacter rhodanostii]
MNFEAVKKQENTYIMHSYGRVDIALTEGKNATTQDIEGKTYIDFTSGIGVNSLGYCNEKWVAAVQEQAGKIQHISNYYYSPVNTELAERLAKAAGMCKSFFCNSGAEANECATKIARKYGEAFGADKIVTLKDSFHGRTITTLSATGQDSFHQDFLPLTEGFTYADKDSIASVQEQLDGTVCAVLIELIQGEGGVIPLEKQFVKDLRTLCDEKGVLLIIDEVQTGIGRTGSFFAYQDFDISPDVVTAAKGLGGGLPIGVCLVNEKLQDIFKPGMNGSTFGGNPVVGAGALVVLDYVTEPAFLQAVNEKSDYIKKVLDSVDEVEFVRGKGLMLGIKLKSKNAKEVLLQCAEKGLLILTAKDLVRFLPPLTITKDELDKGLVIFKEVLSNNQ